MHVDVLFRICAVCSINLMVFSEASVLYCIEQDLPWMDAILRCIEAGGSPVSKYMYENGLQNDGQTYWTSDFITRENLKEPPCVVTETIAISLVLTQNTFGTVHTHFPSFAVLEGSPWDPIVYAMAHGKKQPVATKHLTITPYGMRISPAMNIGRGLQLN
ncbi:hypothetical protein MAR_015065 [Mya arenaria]|uniref:Uncharacterized protein n=1 Tax=Mya arenaria TaxID=6604 RepID=A0ABY7FJK7_MYAAR|nr:hypothetical protein MAR_015065 [Mya arenaria]